MVTRLLPVILAFLSSPALAQPWASTVIDYLPGSGATFTKPDRALRQPARFTGESSPWPGSVSPFSPPWLESELVSIGPGGHLILSFHAPLRDNPLNPFGLDLLVFSNAFLLDTNWPHGVAGPLFASDVIVEASLDGSDWKPLVGAPVRPTLGFLDLNDPYASPHGSMKTNFTSPVDPAIDLFGLDFQGLIHAYAGSGGGQGFDLAGSGLAEAYFIRLTVPSGATSAFQLDALARVAPIPAPAALSTALASLLLFRRRR